MFKDIYEITTLPISYFVDSFKNILVKWILKTLKLYIHSTIQTLSIFLNLNLNLNFQLLINLKLCNVSFTYLIDIELSILDTLVLILNDDWKIVPDIIVLFAAMIRWRTTEITRARGDENCITPCFGGSGIGKLRRNGIKRSVLPHVTVYNNMLHAYRIQTHYVTIYK